MTVRRPAGIMPEMAEERVTSLLRTLRAGGLTARRRALETLARRRERGAAEEVARLLRDPVAEVREAAREASPKTAW